MKTTLDLSDHLIREASDIAAREGIALHTLLEHGLRLAIAERLKTTEFKLRDASFGGSGLQPELAGEPWEFIREISYGGRGQ